MLITMISGQWRKAILVESCCKMCFCDCHACQNLCSSEVVLKASLSTQLSSKKTHGTTWTIWNYHPGQMDVFLPHIGASNSTLNPRAYGIGKALSQRSCCDLHAAGHSKFRMSRRTAAFKHQQFSSLPNRHGTKRQGNEIYNWFSRGWWLGITCDTTCLGIFQKISILTLALT